MNKVPRDKFEVIDLIFMFLFAISFASTALVLFDNLIISIIYTIIVVIFSVVTIFLWIIRNPFNMYLVRTFAFSNFLFTLISLMVYASRPELPIEYQSKYGPILIIFCLVPSIIYLAITTRFVATSTLKYKRAGAALAFMGRIKNVEQALYGDTVEDKIRREDAMAKIKKVYNQKIVIVLCIVFVLCSITALIFGFY
jgi:hypothetical protein